MDLQKVISIKTFFVS
jgi:hypothetical protein